MKTNAQYGREVQTFEGQADKVQVTAVEID